MSDPLDQTSGLADGVLKVSVQKSVSSTDPISARSTTWAELVELLRAPKTVHKSKSACALLKLAAFGDKRRRGDKGSFRHDGNVIEVFGIEGDYDAEKMSPAEAAALLRKACIRSLVYTSPSHCVVGDKSRGGPRWRVLAPLAKSCSPAERARFLDLLNGALGGVLNGESWTLSQTYYFGRVEGVEYEFHNVDGVCIDELDASFSAPAPIGKAGSATEPASSLWTSDELQIEVAQIRERMKSDANADALAKLWAGDLSQFGKSHSEADLTLCNELAYYGGKDPVLIDAAFRASGLMRPKWEREDYREDTIAKAIAGCGTTWTDPEEISAGFEVVTAANLPTKHARLLGPDKSRFSLSELIELPPEPKLIVDGYLLEDAGQMSAPGGTGKTTLAIQECVHIILGRPLYGRQVKKPGAVLFVTAEDDRGTTLYRLHHICQALKLTAAEYQQVRDGFFIEDLSAAPARLVRMVNGELRATDLVDEIIARYSGCGISYCHFDPTSLVGPGEAAGNDGMSDLMHIGRRISRPLGCSVRFVHHVSKAVAREGTMDQYAGRGGAAFADNARFVQQLTAVDNAEFMLGKKKYSVAEVVPQAAAEIAEGNVLALMVHKVSYQRRDPHPIFLVRRGFTFEHYLPKPVVAGADTSLERRMERVHHLVAYIGARLDEGLRLTATKIEKGHLSALGMKRDEARVAIDMALQGGYLVNRELPEEERQGGAKCYLAPADGQSLDVTPTTPPNPAVTSPAG